MRPSKLFWKVFLACVLLIVLSAGVFGLLVTRGQSVEMRKQLTDELRVTAVLVGNVVAEHVAGRSWTPEIEDRVQDLVREMGQETGIRLTVILPDGRVVAESGFDDPAEMRAMDNHRDRPELRAAFANGQGQSQRFSATRDEESCYFATRIDRDGVPILVSRASLPLDMVQSTLNRLGGLVWLFAGLMSAVTIAGTYYIVSRMVQPLIILTRAVERMADEDFAPEVRIPNRDEVGLLAHSFNRMSRELSTRIRELRERGDQLAAVLSGMVEGVVAVDQNQKVLFANDSARRFLGLAASDVKGRPLIATLRDETLQRSVRHALATGDSVDAELTVRTPNPIELSVHVAPLPGEPCPGVVLVFDDLTELRRLESLRQEFVANVSHELKTPLSSIKAYAETLREGALNDPANNENFVIRIEEQAERLHQLILDLLSLARIESGEKAYEVRDVSVKNAVEECLQRHVDAAQAKRIKLAADAPSEPVLARADVEAVQQILDNLVDNAIKYSPEDGTVRVRWRSEDPWALIEVIDSGIGIAIEDQPRLFERFFRVDKARSRELGGTGLGLSIVKHLTQFFNGRTGVISEPGKGSTFWVRLPLVPSTT